MQKFKGQPWTYDALNDWLFKPSAYAPGTRMTFAGITSDKQRADVIAYLRSLSDSPEPLPSPQEAQQATPPTGAAGGEKPAEPKAPAASPQPAAAPATPPKP
jgi:cytochrome c